MKTRSMLILGLIVAATAITAMTAIAGSMGWSDEPVIETWSDAGPKDQPMLFEAQVWLDGSAEFKVTPKIELSSDQLPSIGEIIVNDDSFKMAQRADREGRMCLFGSVPVGTFSLTNDFHYTLKAYDSHGVMLVDSYGHHDVP